VPPPNMLLFRVNADPAFVVLGEILQVSQLAVEGQTEPLELRRFLPAAASEEPAGGG
jgi:hypothetical protein